MESVTRRSVLGATAAVGLTAALPFASTASAQAPIPARRLTRALERLEEEHQGRLGVAWIDPVRGTTFAYRGDERFAMCSTFKTYASAAVLLKASQGTVDLTEPQRVPDNSVARDSTESRDYIGCEMPLRWATKVALVASDNAAGNRMLEVLGGPGGLTAFARSIGDTVTRLDRIEPDLNEAIPGDLRDTTSPTAIAEGYRRLILGDVLPTETRALLRRWMTANVTSATRIRAGLPDGWTSADKTGAGSYGTINDVGVVTDPRGRDFVIAVLSGRPELGKDAPGSPELVSGATRLVVGALGTR